jgi:long-chain fatty acid transport protein
MKKTISAIALVSMFAASSAMASGFRIPEQSLDSTAKSGASIASADSADIAYYNPAGMGMLADTWSVEGTFTYLHLTSIEYEDNRSALYDGDSTKENFLLPTFFMVSPDFNNFRFGFALTEPFGLQKRWDDMFPAASAKKYGIKVFEFNPTVSYKISEMFAIGGGVRFIYSEASLRTDGAALGSSTMALDGDTTEWGWNAAVDFKPMDNLNFALTYRSKVDLGWEGDATVSIPGMGTIATGGGTTVPAPAVLAFSTAYTVGDFTFDLTIDQTFWSDYEDLVIEFDLLPNVEQTKDWEDTIAVRLGVDYRLNDTVTLMAGIAYDENPVPDEHVGFELPDSDAWLFSFGAKFQVTENMQVGGALLYDYKEERDVTTSTINGTFSNASAILVSAGIAYQF